MTKTGGSKLQKTDVKVSLIGGHRLKGETLHERTLTASLIGGADIDLRDIDIPDGAELRVTKLSLIGGVSLTVRPDVVVRVYGIRLGGCEGRRPERAGRPDGPYRRLGTARRSHCHPRVIPRRRSACGNRPAG
ncbi:hypothetical protein ACIRQH_12695 [Streptomyces sp. NPDC102279]|uniref:hypothetical protein n=1 Tax=Streptomyces sp. NPDC102279 TaxID=3366153 RepID=UPI00380FA026